MGFFNRQKMKSVTPFIAYWVTWTKREAAIMKFSVPATIKRGNYSEIYLISRPIRARASPKSRDNYTRIAYGLFINFFNCNEAATSVISSAKSTLPNGFDVLIAIKAIKRKGFKKIRHHHRKQCKNSLRQQNC